MIFTKQPKFIIGVPITFMFKYNPKQFEIIDMDMWVEDGPKDRMYINGRKLYGRILIRKIK